VNEKKSLGPLDIGSIVAAGVFTLGAFLPMWVVDIGNQQVGLDLWFFGPIGALFRVVMLLFGSIAVLFIVIRLRAWAIIMFAIAGLPSFWMLAVLLNDEDFSSGVGEYLTSVGAVGGIVFLAISSVRPRADNQHPEESVPTNRQTFHPDGPSPSDG
jgi:hypothetical protein